MQNMEPKNNNDFMIEKIKERPINRRKLLRRTLTTALMAVIFGLIACVTFLLLEPIISHWLYPEPAEEHMVLFPEEREEMEPEDMLSDNLEPEEGELPGTTPHPFADDSEKQKQMEELLGSITLDYNNYAQLYSSLADVVEMLDKYMVDITATQKNMDWLSNEYETQTRTTGVVIGNTGKEILILTDYSGIKKADALEITLYTGKSFPVQLKQYHTDADMAVLSLNINTLGSSSKDIYVASFGSSSIQSIICTPVIAMGSPMGERGSVGYGMITSESGQMTMVDANYKVLLTDIYGSQSASGFLFNLKGQIIGIITDRKTSTDMRNMITAYGISDLKKMISTLSEGKKIPYLGITGIDVSADANEKGNVPLGVYVQDVEEDSPALMAGVQKGDIVVGLGTKVITRYNEYANAFGDLEAGATVKLKVMRMSQSEYIEMEFDILLEEAN